MQIYQQLSFEAINDKHFIPLSALFDAHVQHQVHLPALTQASYWAAWIANQHAQGHTHFAIIDKELGCLGASGFEHCKSCDLFYFWLGASYRRQGRGHLIADYVKSYFPKNKPIYALTFADNFASLYTFKKAHWYSVQLSIVLCEMPVCALSHCFVDETQAKQQLTESFIELGSDLQIRE